MPSVPTTTEDMPTWFDSGGYPSGRRLNRLLPRAADWARSGRRRRKRRLFPCQLRERRGVASRTTPTKDRPSPVLNDVRRLGHKQGGSHHGRRNAKLYPENRYRHVGSVRRREGSSPSRNHTLHSDGKLAAGGDRAAEPPKEGEMSYKINPPLHGSLQRELMTTDVANSQPRNCVPMKWPPLACRNPSHRAFGKSPKQITPSAGPNPDPTPETDANYVELTAKARAAGRID